MTQASRAPDPWYRTITADQWRALAAAKLGWMLDAMDFLLYVMAIGQLKAHFGFDDGTAGLLGTVTLITSAVGGIVFGVVADRVGRTRALMATILIFSFSSLGAATSQSVMQLMFWRVLLGFGMGGEWASGAVLVSETWPPQHRTKAISIMQSGWALGYILAAILAAIVLERMQLGPEAWRWLFVIGVAPALFTIWIRRRVREPETWLRQKAERSGGSARGPNPFRALFADDLRRNTILATLLSACVQFANWGLFFWLPGFLATPVDRGGAGMTIVRSAAWIIPLQLGAYVGYNSFGFIAERLGRRRTFICYLVTAAVLVPLYGQMARSPTVLMVMGPLLGFVGYGYFSMFGSFLAELFPTSIRATGQGLTYNVGRGLGALAPFTIGTLATIPRVGIGSALAVTSAFFLAGAVLILAFPDTSGKRLS
ncbi:MAG: MFS transporter [Gemmatimonadota bacterium]